MSKSEDTSSVDRYIEAYSAGDMDFAIENPLIESVPGGKYRLCFGKFRGQLLGDVPNWYLKFMCRLWVEETDNQNILEFLEIVEDL